MIEPKRIRIANVAIDESIEQMVLATLRSGQLAQGPMVARLEEGFASLCGVTHAVAVSNGTVALIAALQALGIGPGDEVITSPFTFVATLNAILACGAVARFADIDPSTFTVDPDAVEDALTSRTRVILPVHLFGQPADMLRLSELARNRGLLIVEDAAQAHGATVDERAVGSYGIGCFSMYATKNITSAEGGIVTTDDDEIADSIRLLRNAGMRARYDYARVGYNYRLTDVHAAIALPQLEKLALTNERRRLNAARLDHALAGIEGLTTPAVAPGRTDVFHQYTVRVTPAAPIDRDQLSLKLAARGIETAVCYPRVVYDYDALRTHPGVVPAHVPEAERAAREVLSLPVHPGLSPLDVDRIAEEVRAALCGGSSVSVRRGGKPHKYWDVMMMRTKAKTPHFVEAVVKDAKLYASAQGDRLAFRNRLDVLCTTLRLMWTTDAFVAQVCYRAQARLDALGVPVLPRLMHRLAIVTGQICIGRAVVVHPGVMIPHGQVVIDGFVEIQPGVAVLSSVTIGIRQGDFRGPTLMRNVRVGTGAKVLGNVTIGPGATIGANAVVLEDVPAGATAVGVPARIVDISN